MLGEHTDEVLAEAGYSSDEIEQLRYCRRRRLNLRVRLRAARFGETSYWTPRCIRGGSQHCDHVFRRIFPHVNRLIDPASNLH